MNILPVLAAAEEERRWILAGRGGTAAGVGGGFHYGVVDRDVEASTRRPTVSLL